MAKPIVTLEGGEKAIVVRRDVPEPVSYQGKNMIELDFNDGIVDEADFFTDKAFLKPVPPNSGGGPQIGTGVNLPIDSGTLSLALAVGTTNNFIASDSQLLSSNRPNATAETASIPEASGTPNSTPINVDKLTNAIGSGIRQYVYRLIDGTISARRAPPQRPDAEPRIYLVETYRLTTNLGDYGAGRVVKTFSLLPGEETKISVRTFRRSETLRKESSSILDSVTSESARDFQNSVESEQSDKASYEKTFEYHAEAEAKASWGWGSAKVSGGVKGSSNAAREEFSKNLSRATEQHSAKASSKREVEINTSTETTETTEEEQSIEREIRNINVGSALNFVFRQMNQEFFSLLHLIDVRVAFFNGYTQSRKEVPLYDLQSLLDEFVKPAHHPSVSQAVKNSLETILDFQGNTVDDFIEERSLPDSDPFLRVNTNLISEYVDPIGGKSFRVPGIIISALRNVMRTEGVIVEALLGEAVALDDYAKRLQELEVERRVQEVADLKTRIERIQLGNELTSSGETDKAAILASLSDPSQNEAENNS